MNLRTCKIITGTLGNFVSLNRDKPWEVCLCVCVGACECYLQPNRTKYIAVYK